MALHEDEHKKDAKHKKLLNLLCIVYVVISVYIFRCALLLNDWEANIIK